MKNIELFDPIHRNTKLYLENMIVIKKTSNLLNCAKKEQSGLVVAVEFAEDVGAISLVEITISRGPRDSKAGWPFISLAGLLEMIISLDLQPKLP